MQFGADLHWKDRQAGGAQECAEGAEEQVIGWLDKGLRTWRSKTRSRWRSARTSI